MEYDLSDKEIRYMIETNHVPVEPDRIILNNGSAIEDGTEIRCKQDGQRWPCAGPRTTAVSTMLLAAGAIQRGFAGIQYDLNSTWRRMPTGEYVGAHLCDHNCTMDVLGVGTGGNYSCPASLSLNKGVSRKWLAPADVILRSIATIEKGIGRARAFFFRTRFDRYCQDYGIPAEAAAAIKDALDSPVLEVNLFGGNPEMHPEVLAIIRELRAAGHRVHFTTTGRRLMRDRAFVDSLVETPPSIIALSADDFDDATHIAHLAELPMEKLLLEWKSVPWQHGQRQKAYEAIYVAKLADQLPEFPPLLFNMLSNQLTPVMNGVTVNAFNASVKVNVCW